IVLMSLGMGMTFVPLTLTAVHHVRSEDSGIGSGVLNTMQQVGGALGLATLATVATHVWSSTGDRLSAAAEKAAALAPAGTPAPSPEEMKAMATVAQHQVFTNGATTAFLLGTGMMLVASLVVWVFLDVKHEELATDGPPVA
ncbi:MAG: family efflux transporter permease subunit, partial [Marmoricola sp.]|nr:family efflux transporter permease subunit [Marmoricola sp.]